MTKYHARRTFSELCQREFDSKAEAVRGEELRLLEMAGEISNLQYQIPFRLSEKPKVTVTVDFAYRERVTKGVGAVGYSPLFTYEDYKGVLTRDFRTKLAWLKEKYGIDVKLIR